MEVGKKKTKEGKKAKTPDEVSKQMKIGKPEQNLFGIVIPIEESEMIFKSERFSVVESYPDVKSAEPTFSLRIDLEEKDVPFFQKILKKLVTAAMQQQKQVENLAKELDEQNDDPEIDFKSAPKYGPDSFKIIRETGEVWGKLYHNERTLKICAPFWMLIEKDGRKKKKRVEANELIGSELSGRICMNVKQIFMAKHKAITCVVSEVLVTEERKPFSNFDEFSDED